jgi:hypothetical protein
MIFEILSPKKLAKIFSPKKLAKILLPKKWRKYWRFLLKLQLVFVKILSLHCFKKTPIFFSANWPKSQKIVNTIDPWMFFSGEKAKIQSDVFHSRRILNAFSSIFLLRRCTSSEGSAFKLFCIGPVRSLAQARTGQRAVF